MKNKKPPKITLQIYSFDTFKHKAYNLLLLKFLVGQSATSIITGKTWLNIT